MTLERLRAWVAPRTPVLLAVTMFAAGSLILAADLPFMAGIEGNDLPQDNPVRLLTLAVLCGAELLRQRAPGVALSIAVVIVGVEFSYGVTLATVMPFADLLFAATLYGSRRTNRIVVGATGTIVLVLVVVSALTAHDARELVLKVLQVSGIPLIPVWWGMNVRHHRDNAEAERARADQLARIAELDRGAAVQAERARMARDLHDVIAGHLSAIAIQSEAVLSMMDSDPARMRMVLRSVRENSVASLTEMRAMIHLLRSSDEASGSTVEHTAPARLRDLQQLLESARAAGLSVSASTSVEGNLPVAVDLSAYRIVQEALTNVVKHAPGAAASVTVGRRDETLVVEVVNDRTQSTSDSARGHGLLSMRERAQAVGGVLEAGPHERQWRVRAELPAGGE